jgi:hypothetical protein
MDENMGIKLYWVGIFDGERELCFGNVGDVVMIGLRTMIASSSLEEVEGLMTVEVWVVVGVRFSFRPPAPSSGRIPARPAQSTHSCRIRSSALTRLDPDAASNPTYEGPPPEARASEGRLE